MIAETSATAKRIGFNGFFYVCLDQECVDVACANGVFAFLYSAKTKAKVAEAKFGTAAILSKLHKGSFTFFEMDIW